jgi:hypothetical protein
MAAALATGQLKHKLYRLDPGQPISRWTASNGQENNEGDTTMSKLAQTISEGVKALKHSKGDMIRAAKRRALNVKAISELKLKSADEKVKTKTAAKAAERKAKKEELRAKKAASKEAKAKAKAEAKEAKLKSRAEKKAKQAAKAAESKTRWYAVEGEDSKNLTSGPHATCNDALAAVGDGSHNWTAHFGGCYRRSEVQKDGTKKHFFIMREEYAKKNGYTLPKSAKTVTVTESPAPLRRRK